MVDLSFESNALLYCAQSTKALLGHLISATAIAEIPGVARMFTWSVIVNSS